MRVFRRLARLTFDRRGAVSPILTLMLIPLVGVLGMATEASSWFLTQRAMQNAADSAALAAATNGCAAADDCHTKSFMPTYLDEAKAVATEFKFKDGEAHTTVTASNAAICPDGTAKCYSVTITRQIPIYLVRVVGFNGDVALDGGRAQTVEAVAVAGPKTVGVQYCMTALGSGSSAINIVGAPELGGGCSMLVPNGGANCTNQAGNKIKYADVKTFAPSQKACGEQRAAGPFTDAFEGLKTNIPSALGPPCNGVWPQAKKGVVAADHQLNGFKTFTIDAALCGDIQLNGDVTVPADSVLLIQNGALDLKDHTLSTSSGAHLTIIFSGTVGSSSGHNVFSSSNGAKLDFVAPKSGTWSGVAIYQDPRLTSGVNLTYAGSNPEFNITGLIYAPNADISISGAIDHATAGDACLAFLGKTISINGTTAIFANPTRECDRAGLALPFVGGVGSARASLVQ